MSNAMLTILKISITFLFVIICTTRAQISEPLPLAPKCEGDICYCSPGTHEAVFNGRKFCETDSKESCPEYAIRLSPQVCECKKGYRYLNNERKVCIPEHMETPVIPADDGDADLNGNTNTTVSTITTTTTTTQRIFIPTTTETTTSTTTTTTSTATNTTTTSQKPARSDETEIRSNKFYITIGIVVLVITVLILIALLWLQLKR